MASSLTLFTGSIVVGAVLASGVTSAVTQQLTQNNTESLYALSNANSAPALLDSSDTQSDILQLTHVQAPLPQLGCNCPFCCSV